MADKITINDYMKKYNIKSRQTVYNKIESGEIESIKEGHKLYIIEMDNGQKQINEMDLLKKIIDNLEEQKKELKEEKSKLIEDNKYYIEEHKKLQYNYNDLSDTMRQIEYKSREKDQENQRIKEELDIIRQELIQEKSKKWWQKLLKK